MKTKLSPLKIISWVSAISLWSIGAIKAPQSSPNVQTDKIVFAVIGDYGEASQPEADVANLVKSWNPDFIVTVGDNNYPNGALSTIDENIGQYYHEYIFPYRGKYGTGSATRRFFPALGNHDWGTGGINQYYTYFSFYHETGYYDFIKGSVHFFILDSDPHEPDGTSSTSQQAKWLKKGLAASTSDFNVVVMHHAPYSSGKHGSTNYMQWPYKAWGADVILSGHDHTYERVIVDGIPYFVNGVGGSELYGFETVLPGSQNRFNQDYGAMRVEATSLSMKFQFFTRAGILIDDYTISNSVPTVSSITRTQPIPSNIPVLDFLVTFSEAVTGVDVSDFSVNANNVFGASISSVRGVGETYVVSVNSGTGDGTIRLDLIDNDSIANSYGYKLGDVDPGNGNYSNGEVYDIDKSSPTVVSSIRSGPNPSNAISVDFLVTFSEPVLGLDPTDFSIYSSNGASLNAFNGAGNMYTISVNTSLGNDTLRLDILDNDSITDVAGNKLGGNGPGNGNYTNGEYYSIDRIAPTLTSIIRSGSNPSSAANVDYFVTFSEPVNGVDASDFSLVSENISQAFISGIRNSGLDYIVTVNTGFGTGTIRMDLNDDDSITDVIGNQLGGMGTGNGLFITGETYNIEKSSPLVTSITPKNTNPSNSDIVDWVVTFSETVFGLDSSDFGLVATNISGASITSVNGSDNLYTISANSGFGDGTLRLDIIDNDSIVNSAGIPLGNVGANNGDYTNTNLYSIDKSSPIVTSISRASTNPSGAASIDFIVTFSELVNGVDISDFSLSTDGLTGAFISTVTDANPFYVVSVNTGTGTGTIRLDLIDDEGITDIAGNSPGGPGVGNGNFFSGEIYNIERSFPRVTSITRASPNPSASASVDFIVTFSESVSGVDASDFSLSTTNILNSKIDHVTDVDPFYIVTVNTGVGIGTIRLDLIDNDSISNVSGSMPGGPGSGNGNFLTGETFSVSKVVSNFPAPSLRDPRKYYLTNNQKVSFSWDKVRGASAYEIIIASDNNFTQIAIVQVVNGLSFTNNIPLKDNFYYWRVRAYNSSFEPGKFSVTNKFTIDTNPPPIPILLKPANNTVTTKTNFSWEKISSATKYQIEIDKDPDFSSPEWSSLRNNPKYQASNMRRGAYYWHVRAKDMAGNWGAWSEPFILYIP